MKSLALLILVFGFGASLTGCVDRPPLISHAHLGHCLTSWSDTPGQHGLLPVARQELDTARREADTALADSLSPAQKAVHIRNVARALAPDAEQLGPGLGYGAIRALEAAVEHLEYAATADDASTNVVSGVAGLSAIADSLLERMRAVAARAKSADVRDAAALDRTALELRGSLHEVADDFDQMQRQLDGMLAREVNPKYQPLERKYLLGLVRLPSGKWMFASLRGASSKPTYAH
jgi:hypothetical protein